MVFPIIQFIQELDEDLTNLAIYNMQPQRANGSTVVTLNFKTIDPPIIKTFHDSLSAATVSTTITETMEWSNTYQGASTAHIQAGASNMMLVILKALSNGSGSTTEVFASNTLDTEDGREVITGWNPITGTQWTPVPIILDVNQYLTLTHTNGPTFNRITNIEGYTVELPVGFALT